MGLSLIRSINLNSILKANRKCEKGHILHFDLCILVLNFSISRIWTKHRTEISYGVRNIALTLQYNCDCFILLKCLLNNEYVQLQSLKLIFLYFDAIITFPIIRNLTCILKIKMCITFNQRSHFLRR